MSFKSVEQTFVYQNLNKNNVLSQNIVKTLTGGQQVTKSDIEEAFLLINKNFKYPLKFKVMEAVDRGDLIMLYAPEGIRIPTTMPFFLTKNSNGKVVAAVVISVYGSKDKSTGNISVDAKKLYCMLEGAYFAKLYYHQYHEVGKRSIIISEGSAVWANMFARVLSKKYALNSDKSKLHKVLLLASKFYMVNILGMKDNEITTNYAMKNCVGGNAFILKEVSTMLKEEDYKSIATFIQAITRTEFQLGMSDLTVRAFLESYILMYDASAIMSLEYFPYFMYNVLSVTNAAYINNQYILEDIMDKHGPKMYNDLVAIDR